MYDIDAVIALAVQLETMNKKIDGLAVIKQQALALHYDLCGGSHGSQESKQ